jgi:hypothetical protein
LIEASRSDWREVEPAIFGTLLERALDPVERHKLGAHYTPRAYVERLVLPTVIEPLRAEWQAVQAAAVTLAKAGKLDEAAEAVKDFHRHLCEVRVLDPACGSGNFLYVTLEHLKRLEGEVINTLDDLGVKEAKFEIEGFTVDPHQLLGLEVNPRAAAIADLVLWIGYLQWHFRTRGDAKPSEPVLRKFRNIECRDAVLAYDAIEIVTGDDGQPITRWDGRTMKKHPVTGEDVPDETARVPLYRYVNARKAEWPAADYVVGNPPFVGNKRMRMVLGDGYTETIRRIYADLPEAIDYVMYWWDRAAQLLKDEQIYRFGFITTNSITQTFNRKILKNYLEDISPISLGFAVPDHPWVDSADGASVRIAMTCAQRNIKAGRLCTVAEESPSDEESVNVICDTCEGLINSDLTTGANLTSLVELESNKLLSGQGVLVLGEGFLLTKEEAEALIQLEPQARAFIKRYRNGKDLMQIPRNIKIIDLYGVTSETELRKYPHVYQRIFDLVRPARLEMKDKARRERWWLFGRSNKEIRQAIRGVPRYIATCRTAKHRVFLFLDSDILPDTKVVAIGLSDAFHLGVLCSHAHLVFAKEIGGWLGVGNDPTYNNADCFNKFSFPDCTTDQQAQIRALGEQLDAHRKRQQALHPDLTLTEMYNVLEKLRAGATLNDKERVTHERGLVAVLRQLHDELDAAVAAAYGWPATLSDEEILQRLVALNAERAREEQAGLIRWLRPDYQQPAAVQTKLGLAATEQPVATNTTKTKPVKLAWPKTLPEQATALRTALTTQNEVFTAEQLAKTFTRARTDTVESLLQTLVSLGLAREIEKGRFTG